MNQNTTTLYPLLFSLCLLLLPCLLISLSLSLTNKNKENLVSQLTAQLIRCVLPASSSAKSTWYSDQYVKLGKIKIFLKDIDLVFKRMALLGCGFNHFFQLSPNSSNSSDSKVKEFGSIQLDLKPEEKILDCIVSWSQIAFSTDQCRVIKCGFDDGLSTSNITEYQISPLSFSMVASELLIVGKDRKIYRWKDKTCQRVISKDATIRYLINEIEAGEINCIGLTVDGIPLEIDQSQVGEDVIFVGRPLPSKTAIKHVTCGAEHALLLSELGSVLSYGIGSRGQTGLGTTEEIQNAPRIIEALEGVKMIGIAAGNWHSVAISEFGDLYSWGWNESGQLGLPSPNLQDSSSSNSYKQNLDGKCKDSVLIQALPHLVLLPDKERTVIKVACGARHTAVLSDDQQLLTCGWNGYGQLGHGDLVSRDNLTPIKYLKRLLSGQKDLIKIQDVFCGGWNTVILTDILESSPS